MDIKVTSANIRFQNEQDGANDWPHRRILMSNILMDFRPNFLGTQEGREPQLRNLCELLPGYVLIDSHRDWIAERMYPCIFIRPDVTERINSGDIWLSKTPNVPASKSFDSAFPRLCTWLHGKDKLSNKEFLFVVTHLDHKKEETRIEQAKVLSQEILKINPCLPLILIGDFNTNPQSKVHEILTKDLNVKDHWLEKKIPEETSHHKFTGSNPAGSRIDWMLVSDKFYCEEVYLDKTNRDGIYPSDHFPLMGKFIHIG
ncbi:MAG: endonuclease/exonuclease/phosphatase family protein [Bacteriovoracaceae bacterium]|jgi:endonuclease/exonuclease/phosphatase family metal-dependent hydrolase|nr:endonuclease/exonuclease/phosphatase family protein [Bacteriovoracaceae bacterium]